MSAPNVVVIGGGPAGLMAAETLSNGGARVVVIDHRASFGRKFLLAGRGGLNLTHSEDLESLLGRYRDPAPQLVAAVRAFDNQALRNWADGLGAETFVGSSGRVFPRAMRAAPLLRAWLARLDELGVEFRTRHEWIEWPAVVRDRVGVVADIEADAIVVALGGASWPNTGSDGAWTNRFGPGTLRELVPSNMGFRVDWSEEFRTRFGGSPIKDAVVSFEGQRSRGDLMVTTAGVEGGALYPLSSPLRDAIASVGRAHMQLDLRPDQTLGTLTSRLAGRRKGESVATWLRGAGLNPLVISLLREMTGNAVPDDPARVATLIKACSIELSGFEPIGRAIASAGGLRFDALDDSFMIRDRPGVFAAGEMLDWDAPTGGYLLQACFSTGVAAARGVLAWLAG